MHQEFDPPDPLRDAIQCFWHERRDYGQQPVSFEVMPDGYAEIIFYFGSGIACEGDVQPLPSPFLMGLLNQPARFTASGRLDILGVRCFPWTVFDLLGLPSGQHGVRVFEHPIAQLQRGLQQCVQEDRIDDAVMQLHASLLAARAAVAVDSMLFKAGTAMRGAHGALPVNQVAAAAHATVRTLERKFKHSSGHTVKDVSGLIRFEQVRNQLWNAPDSNIAALAQQLGYTDQSHLSREFKRYSGTTPAAFARQAKQRLQAAEFVAFVQA